MSFSEFGQKLAQRVQQGQFPGVRQLHFKGGERVFDQSLGYSDIESGAQIHENSIFRLASASKIFVSCAFLTLVEKGDLTLNASLDEVLPEFSRLNVLDHEGQPRPTNRKITMEDLLQHTCGYGYGDRGAYREALMQAGLLGVEDTAGGKSDHWMHDYTLRDWASKLAAVPMESEPGTRVSYGLGHDIAGAVIEAVSGQNLSDYMEQHLFKPLGLNDTFFVVPPARLDDLTSFYHAKDGQLQRVETARESGFAAAPKSYSGGGGWDMLGNGGIASSAPDVMRLLQMIMADGRFGKEQLIRPELAQKLQAGTTNQLAQSEMLPGCSYSYGASCVEDLEKYDRKGPIGKMSWGGSTNTFFYYLPNQQAGGIFLTHAFPFGAHGAIYHFNDLATQHSVP